MSYFVVVLHKGRRIKRVPRKIFDFWVLKGGWGYQIKPKRGRLKNSILSQRKSAETLREEKGGNYFISTLPMSFSTSWRSLQKASRVSPLISRLR